MDKWLDYDHVSLIPTHVSSLAHRVEADPSVQFGPIKLKLPLIAAPMPDVSNGLMAAKLAQLGSFGFIHRFQYPDDQINELELAIKDIDPVKIGMAISLNATKTEMKRWKDYGVKIFCLDTANGASVKVQEALGRLKDLYPDSFIITGNIASRENYLKLWEWGADAVRVGIAGGSVCETRTETGVYSPMAGAIMNCAEPTNSSMKLPLLIADGGIKSPSDMCKAITLGADLVMAGGIFAGTKEAPGDPINTGTHEKPQLVKLMRGAASYSVQNGKSEYVEGRETFVSYKGSVERVINRYIAGLRSSMSYNDARDLNEFRHNVKVIEI